ncbi:MAG: Isoquinoline 1-oxidoreductase subunit [Pseudomonadota bacterium]
MRCFLLVVVLTLSFNASAETLRNPAEFSSIENPDIRAAALFQEAAKVFQHARCANCHPAGDRPGQTDEGRPHSPAVIRGEDGFGHPAMRCESCHMEANRAASGVPGAPHWHLAQASMALVGRSPGEICRQIKDPEQNGGRPVGAIVMHVAFDPLIKWAWFPGGDRTPAPGSHQDFVALVHAWIEAGAACPND